MNNNIICEITNCKRDIMHARAIFCSLISVAYLVCLMFCMCN